MRCANLLNSPRHRGLRVTAALLQAYTWLSLASLFSLLAWMTLLAGSVWGTWRAIRSRVCLGFGSLFGEPPPDIDALLGASALPLALVACSVWGAWLLRFDFYTTGVRLGFASNSFAVTTLDDTLSDYQRLPRKWLSHLTQTLTQRALQPFCIFALRYRFACGVWRV